MMKWENKNQFASREYVNEFSDLSFLNNDYWKEVNSTKRFETHNLVHWFSRKMKFSNFLLSLDEFEKQGIQIYKRGVEQFLLTNSEEGKSNMKHYEHLEMDVHFVIKQKNRGKIESHLWLFKGFCSLIQPIYCVTVDVGTIQFWNSASKIIFYMDAFEEIGGATGEI